MAWNVFRIAEISYMSIVLGMIGFERDAAERDAKLYENNQLYS